MKAAFITQTGGPEVLQFGEQPEPDCGSGQLLIDVLAAAVNPIDTYIRSGAVEMDLPKPFIVGCDFAGVVREIGSAVTRFRPGDRVWGSNQGLLGRQGTFAETIAVDECWAYSLPDGVDPAVAAAGALTGITAGLGLFLHANLQPRETVFVNGGTGGVGSAVVQLARSQNANVIATASSAEKQRQCTALGATSTLNYNDADFDEQLAHIASSLGGIDIWWETRREPTIERSLEFLNKRGRLVIMAGRQARPEFPVGAFYTRDLKLVGFAMFNATSDEQREIADRINELAAVGRWQPIIGQRFPLDAAAKAHQLQEDNTLQQAGTLSGKIVIDMT